MALRLFSQIEDRLNNIRTTLSEAPHYPNIHLYIYINFSYHFIYYTQITSENILLSAKNREREEGTQRSTLEYSPFPDSSLTKEGGREKKFSGIRVTVERRSEGGEREREGGRSATRHDRTNT